MALVCDLSDLGKLDDEPRVCKPIDLWSLISGGMVKCQNWSLDGSGV